MLLIDYFIFFIQTHPNVDKRLFQDKSVIALKGEGKSFPISQDIGVLKWRLQTTDDSLLPLFSELRREWGSEGGRERGERKGKRV